MATETDAARDRVIAARADLESRADDPRGIGPDAVDIPAKIKRSPAKAAAVVGGVGFLALKGPQRVFGVAKRAVRGTPKPLPKSMLPDEIEKTLRALGTTATRSAAPSSATSRPTPRSRPRRTRASAGRAPVDGDAVRRAGRQDRGGRAVPAGRGDASPNGWPPSASGPSRRSTRRATPRPKAKEAAAERRRPRTSRGRRRLRAVHSAPGEWRNGRRAGLRSRCRVSGVSVRPRPRLPPVRPR